MHPESNSRGRRKTLEGDKGRAFSRAGHTQIRLVMSGLCVPEGSSAWELKPMSLLSRGVGVETHPQSRALPDLGMPGSSGRKLAEDVENPLLLPLVVIPDVE